VDPNGPSGRTSARYGAMAGRPNLFATKRA